jgi:4-amino-4-deoxy-L-arabinose transferase-like glycosyltransferase
LRTKYAAHRPVVNAYLVRERDRRRVRELAVVCAVVLPLALALLSYTWVHLEALRTGYRIDTLERELHELSQFERRQRLEASYLASPQRLAERAGKELGMGPPSADQVLFATEFRR